MDANFGKSEEISENCTDEEEHLNSSEYADSCTVIPMAMLIKIFN